jgi:hypothetical protein
MMITLVTALLNLADKPVMVLAAEGHGDKYQHIDLSFAGKRRE